MDKDLRDLLTFARYEARKCIKELSRSEGIKLSDWSMRDLRIASEEYLADHWNELRPKAEEYLRYSKAQDEKRRAKIASGAQKRKAEKSKASVVQMSGAK